MLFFLPIYGIQNFVEKKTPNIQRPQVVWLRHSRGRTIQHFRADGTKYRIQYLTNNNYWQPWFDRWTMAAEDTKYAHFFKHFIKNLKALLNHKTHNYTTFDYMTTCLWNILLAFVCADHFTLNLDSYSNLTHLHQMKHPLNFTFI